MAERLAGLAERLGLADRPDRPERIRLAALYLTALANERLGRGFAATAIALADAAGAVRALRGPDDPRLAGDAGELLALLARARAEELAPVAAGDVPPEALAQSAALWVA
jgi:hypothetical protein